MSDHVTDQIGALIKRISGSISRKVADGLILLLNHKSAGSFGAIAGFAIAVVFTWKYLKAPRARPRRKRRVAPPSGEGNGVGSSALASDSDDKAVLQSAAQELNLGQIVRRKLNGGRKMTVQLLGVILEERTPEELQKQATVKSSVLEVLSEISKSCDVYLMERVLDDESEEKILAALESAGLFLTAGLTKEKVLFCGTEMGRCSFVRQLEPDWHVDSNLEVISQLSRFIRNQLFISQLEMGKIAANVFTSESLEQYFTSL